MAGRAACDDAGAQECERHTDALIEGARPCLPEQGVAGQSSLSKNNLSSEAVGCCFWGLQYHASRLW